MAVMILWAVFCVMPALHAGCGVLVEYLMCLHGRVQSGSCAVVVTSSLPVASVGHRQVSVPVYRTLLVDMAER